LAGGATVLATLIALMGSAYSYGRRIERRMDFHEEIRRSHHELHSDVEVLIDNLNEVNGTAGISGIDECPTCTRAEEEAE